MPVLRHGPVIAHILDTAITCTGPQDPRLFTLLENDQMAQVRYKYNYYMHFSDCYSGGDKTSVKTLKSYKAYISHNKAKNPINLGAK